ncbi:rhodanese-like domain-containing protein [Leeuwenhoekiella marinoflava]|uniref:Rhodanese-related sulfurtransferase n=2 Tax=Leeuwenhoekiella marinoflava TaxID=988 RepID=A0A4Q0PMM4_9FLAO|nr:rhodanese-like domain-containing protein [Leeuwenhoekiella marinoflava]RXG31717.1 rhodanese-related sulfurtransferase [Leeuwenhoekiella marinoflava]SHF07592.1 Rhodanese-related sulfurtransferase [Leeuwenhoekiella marinoflava DSM 3653]
MKFTIFLTLLIPFCGFSQEKSIDRLLDLYNTRSVPYISVQELKMKPEAYVILDTRKTEEFNVSHLPGAVWVGEKPHETLLNSVLNSKKPVVVYCTVGIRSEDYGEKLNRTTKKQVYNLYGGIFAWKDAGYKVIDHKGKPTEQIHTFAKNWEDYLKTGIAVH